MSLIRKIVESAKNLNESVEEISINHEGRKFQVKVNERVSLDETSNTELKSVEWFKNASNSDINKLNDGEGFENGRSVRHERIRKELAKKYGYEEYRDIPTKLLTFEEFLNVEIEGRGPYNPHGYDFWTAESDYNEMITW